MDRSKQLITYIFPCILCDEEFDTDRLLRSHAWDCHSKDNACGLCGGAFNDRKSLKQHIDVKHQDLVALERTVSVSVSVRMEHNGGVTANGKEADDGSSDYYNGGEHSDSQVMIRGKGGGTITASEKSATNSCVEMLQANPYTEKSDDSSSMCDICGVILTNKSEWTSHKREHAENYLYNCEHCEKRFVTESALDRHREIHKTSDLFRCDLCTDVLDSVSDLITHNQTVHSDIGKLKHSCDVCGRRNTSSQALYAHRKLHEKKKDHVCSSCGLSFHFSRTLKRHIDDVHLKLKKFECKHCSKAFSRRHHLNYHERAVHEKIRSFPCDFCENQSFFSKYAKDRHMESKHGVVQPRRLRYCDKTPREEQSEKMMNVTHVQIEPEICTEGSSSNVNVQHIEVLEEEGVHVSSLDSDKMLYQCSECMKLFKTLGGMKRHVANHVE